MKITNLFWIGILGEIVSWFLAYESDKVAASNGSLIFWYGIMSLTIGFFSFCLIVANFISQVE